MPNRRDQELLLIFLLAGLSAEVRPEEVRPAEARFVEVRHDVGGLTTPRVPRSHALLEQCDVLIVRHVSPTHEQYGPVYSVKGVSAERLQERVGAGLAVGFPGLAYCCHPRQWAPLSGSPGCPK